LRPDELSPETKLRRREEAIAFLRRWLPENARTAYRELIREQPETWWQDPHFAGGVIPEHALRGNGIDERALGVDSLDRIWPELLAAAVLNEEPGCDGERDDERTTRR
jgi:hypothetical protein